MSDTIHVEFDASPEDVADVSVRMTRRIPLYRQRRVEWQWAGPVIVAGVLIVMLQERLVRGGAIAIAALGAAAAAYLFPRFYDNSLRSGALRIVRQSYGDIDAFRCQFELREEGLWVRMAETEILFRWSPRTDITDTGDDIELWFAPGLAVVRNRAFQRDEDRRAFLETAAELVRRSA